MKSQFDILFLVGSGIGNAIEMLYALEYCLKLGKSTAAFFTNIPDSFVDYLRESYGPGVILESLDGVTATNLVHSWLYQDRLPSQYAAYFYVHPTYHNTLLFSETEQYLSIARSLYPSDRNDTTLSLLKEDYSDRIRALRVEEKCVVYPGCSSMAPSKRWPYFAQLTDQLGEGKAIIIGGQDDLVNVWSYYYPKWLTFICPPFLLRRVKVFNLFKGLGFLSKHSHLSGIEKRHYSYFNTFKWAELTALLRRAGFFIGNDGALTHLAGACGSTGLVIFGPSSINKNKAYNVALRPVARNYDCQPCQFRVNSKDSMASGAILCPYQLRCLYSIDVAFVVNAIRHGANGKIFPVHD